MNQFFRGPRWRQFAVLFIAIVGAALVVPTVLGAKSGPAAAPAFRVEIDGVPVEGFKEITGLESEIEVIEFKDGDDPVVRKRPGAVRYSNIVLKRGLTKPDMLSRWFDETRKGTAERKSGSVIYLDRAGAEVLRYNFFEAWPCRWSAPVVDADSTDRTQVEAITFCVERIDRVSR